jgi:hypothetical protein
MIVLDEQLLGRGLESSIAKWYRGAIRFIHELRPGTVVKDDAVPQLLHSQPQPTFVTINVKDFWRKIHADSRFCVVCFPLPDSDTDKVPRLLKQLLHSPRFRTKKGRMGYIIRCSDKSIRYYTRERRAVVTMRLNEEAVTAKH